MAERGKRTDGALLCEDDQPTNQPTAPNPVRVLDESGYRDRTAVIQTMMMMKSGHEPGDPPVPILHERLEMDTDDMTADALLGTRVASPTQTLECPADLQWPGKDTEALASMRAEHAKTLEELGAAKEQLKQYRDQMTATETATKRSLK
jgi:hypothetical protein